MVSVMMSNRKCFRTAAVFCGLVLILILFQTAAGGQERFTTEYRIGPKDLLEISVFGLEELNKSVRVSEDGKISLPLLGEVSVDGLTITQVEQKLSGLLEQKYLHNPQVTVFIREYQSKRVSILGAIKSPGTYQLLGRQTLLQLISHAGGMTGEEGQEIIIIRQLQDGESQSLKISIEDLILKGDPRLNIPLEPGDIVNIPVDKMITLYVFGKVGKPGALQVKKSNIPTLLQAIAQAGGFSERAKKSGVLIKRMEDDGRERKIKVNVKDIIKGKKADIPLEENDIVYVPESIF